MFLLLNGDSWIDVDLVQVANTWRASKAADPNLAAQLLLRNVADAGRFGSVDSAEGRIWRFREKTVAANGRSGLINAGVYVVDRRLIEALEDNIQISLEVDVLAKEALAGRLSGLLAPDASFFIDIGLPETLAEAEKEFMARRTRPALFLDRDGTLNVDRGYTHRVESLEWQPDAKQAVLHANQAGWFVFVITNQAGVARGLYTERDVQEFHSVMQEALGDIGAHIDAFEWCAHHIDARVEAYRRDCRRRKPRAGMIEDLLDNWPVDVERSILIGDADSDMQAALAGGVTGVRYSGGSLLGLVRQHVHGNS
jgi:D-glycero-D-manno-heptose 1,7-bisphosphate phosphatase